jgi:hypothetical protein
MTSRNTPITVAPVSQPAYFPPCGLGVVPRRPVRSTPITLIFDTQANRAQNQNKVVVPTTLVFRPMSTLAINARHPGCRNSLTLPNGGRLAIDANHPDGQANNTSANQEAHNRTDREIHNNNRSVTDPRT